jgi:hypothetical protein
MNIHYSIFIETCYITFRVTPYMATKGECPERYNWWINELESLGISTTKKKKVLNDKTEIRNLTENIKQTLYQDYKTTYNYND